MRHLSSETNSLICNYDKWSGPRVDELLHFLMVLLNSNFETEGYLAYEYDSSLLRSNTLTWWYWAKLNMEYRTYHKLSNLIYGLPLKTIISDARRFFFLTQFMSSQDFLFFKVISWVLLSKNDCLVFLTVFLKSFQFETNLETWYASSLAVYLLFHQSLDYLVILTHFVCLLHIVLSKWANVFTTLSSNWLSLIAKVLMFLRLALSCLIRFFSSSLLLWKNSLFFWMNSS